MSFAEESVIYAIEKARIVPVVAIDHAEDAVALCGALKLKPLGLKRSRSPSAYAIMKRQYGFKGNRAKVLQQAQMVKSWLKENS